MGLLVESDTSTNEKYPEEKSFAVLKEHYNTISNGRTNIVAHMNSTDNFPSFDKILAMVSTFFHVVCMIDVFTTFALELIILILIDTFMTS